MAMVDDILFRRTIVLESVFYLLDVFWKKNGSVCFVFAGDVRPSSIITEFFFTLLPSLRYWRLDTTFSTPNEKMKFGRLPRIWDRL
jgi:hypothetical protein